MRPRFGGVATRSDCRSGGGFPACNIRDRFLFYGAMTKQTLATGILAVALLATPSLTRAGVHFSFGIGLPFFGAVEAPAPPGVVPSSPHFLPPASYPYRYPPVVYYAPPGYNGCAFAFASHHGGWHR